MAANEKHPGEPTSGLDASLGVEGQYTSIFTRQSDETLRSWNRITSVSAGVWGVGLYLSLRVPTFVGTLLVLVTALFTLLFALAWRAIANERQSRDMARRREQDLLAHMQAEEALVERATALLDQHGKPPTKS